MVRPGHRPRLRHRRRVLPRLRAQRGRRRVPRDTRWSALDRAQPGARGDDGALSDYEAALLLQAFFRENFEYDLEQAPEGIGGNAFETFLSDTAPGGRTGYCEQFASAMAVMARMVSIPARVAIGFLAPEDLGNGNFEYSSYDLHAWPELYFEDAGWVRFEPTPSGRAEAAPDYSTVPVDVSQARRRPRATRRTRAERRHPDGSSPGLRRRPRPRTRPPRTAVPPTTESTGSWCCCGSDPGTCWCSPSSALSR